ncbi:MAG: CcmD family protein [Sphingobacteriaceae bacterium]|nr:CcmD family protein [Sphingobacteriaceae bacterium]MBK7310323.1 CcmD family protein [Sphingobacteriaceae bacterium]MBK7816294.1 CcmD family protein [Sphingobacteriaceae bacterium]
MTKKFYLILFLLSTFFANAQEVEMADSFRADGKIYVVITVLAIVFTCIIGILIFLERKLSRLEKEIKETKN